MKVKELKKILEEFSDEDEVIMSQDGEGNEFSPLSDHSHDVYIADSTYSGQILGRPEDRKEGEDEENYASEGEGVNCLTLWPAN